MNNIKDEIFYYRTNLKHDGKTKTYRMPRYFVSDIFQYCLQQKCNTSTDLTKEEKKLINKYLQSLIDKNKEFSVYDNFALSLNQLVYQDIIYHTLREHKRGSLL